MLDYFIALSPPAETSLSGQVLITTKGKSTFVVPPRVRTISGVAIGHGVTFSYPSTNSGGGLSWRNDIPVTPGEELNVEMGSVYNGRQYVYHDSILSRGDVVLLIAQNALNGGLGGKDADPINDGGGNGGKTHTEANSYCSGGGAGGYTGNGGAGGGRYVLGTNGEGGGGAGGGKADGKTSIYGGGGVGCYGQGESGIGQTNGRGNPGSTLSPDVYGGGGAMYNSGGGTREAGPGCLYLIWGEGRFFPNTNVAPIEI